MEFFRIESQSVHTGLHFTYECVHVGERKFIEKIYIEDGRIYDVVTDYFFFGMIKHG